METVDLNVRFSLTVEDLAAQVARNADRQFLEGEHVETLTQIRELLDSLKDTV